MPEPAYTLGLDYGTNSVRCLIVDTHQGKEIASAVCVYPQGDQGILTDSKNPDLARQHPSDYLFGAEQSVRQALQQASATEPTFSPEQVRGIGIDATGSTPLPVDHQGNPLTDLPTFRDHPGAMAWLWKDHTSSEEAKELTKQAGNFRPEYLNHCGGVYSSEWFWAKLLRCIRQYPEVIEAAHSWIEISDWLPAVLTGNQESPVRNLCAAGHKALYHAKWGGYPDESFLNQLHPEMARIGQSLREIKTSAIDQPAGMLCTDWADRLGLSAGTPVATGALDAHLGAVGSGIRPGAMVKIMGTSTCDIIVAPLSQELPFIPGLCGIVPETVLPKHHGLEAGQSAVGDLFHWWVDHVLEHSSDSHESLTEAAEKLQPGESGLLALDWNNGNRCLLCDPLLTGVLLGQTLQTQAHEIYRALIEATAFGARMILERIERYGIVVDTIIACGGLASNNPMLMQIYADITGRNIQVSKSSQTCALGSAIAASVAAKIHPDIGTAQSKMCQQVQKQYSPTSTAADVYDSLYVLYVKLHDHFGGNQEPTSSLSDLMKSLQHIKSKACHS